MKKCKCGFCYQNKEDLERVNLTQTEGVIKYYCPDCKTFKTSEKIQDKHDLVNSNDVKIEFVGNLYESKKDCLWYGGLVCVITYKDISFSILANGDVRGSVYKDGEEVARIKDKSNNGVFYDVITSYLPEVNTDEKLQAILNSDLSSEEIQDKKLTAIVLDNNNWWEAVVEKVSSEYDTEFIDSFTIDISDNIDECINYILNEKDNLYTHFSEYLD